MENKFRAFSALTLFSLIFLAGCITISYDAEQQFRGDGTSLLTVEEYMGLNKESFESMTSMYALSDEQDSSSILMMLLMDYYTTSSYSQFICDSMEDEAVESCEAKSDGYVEMSAELFPGEFYSFDMETDWVNLKEVRTYKIDKVPTATYYAKKDSSDYEEASVESLRAYVEENVDSYIEQDAYCSGYYPFECSFTSYSGTSVQVEITSSSSTPRLVEWVACSDKGSDDYMFVNASSVKDSLQNAVVLNRTLSYSTDPVVASLTCPAGAQSVLVYYWEESYYDETLESDLAVLDITTREEMKEEVLEGLGETDSSLFGDTTSVSYEAAEEYFLDFERGEFIGATYEELAELQSPTALVQMLEIDLKYAASFEGRIVNASIGDEKVDVSGNSIELDLRELEDMPEDPLVVVTEKELSPLGVFTWIIPLAILAVLAAGVVFLVLKK